MIDSYHFGEMWIEGIRYRNDLAILPSRIESNWRRTRGHQLQMEDIKSFLDEIGEFVVIGTGRIGMMKVSDDIINELEKQGITVIVKPTSEAWKQFNALHNADMTVTGMFHLTC